VTGKGKGREREGGEERRGGACVNSWLLEMDAPVVTFTYLYFSKHGSETDRDKITIYKTELYNFTFLISGNTVH